VRVCVCVCMWVLWLKIKSYLCSFALHNIMEESCVVSFFLWLIFESQKEAKASKKFSSYSLFSHMFSKEKVVEGEWRETFTFNFQRMK